MIRLLLVLALGLAGGLLRAQPAPSQTTVLERWARENLFGGAKSAGNSSRWEVPGTANPNHGGVPVTFRTAPHGAALELGEALRHYEIDEPFLLVVGYWQATAGSTRFVQALPIAISAAQWRALWGPVTYADLQRLDAALRDTGPSIEETRRRVLAMKNAPPFSQATIQLIPRIDERGPRRLQCSLRFRDVFTHLAPGVSSDPQEQPTLFGAALPALGPAGTR